jgi:hypothetical protein
LLSGDISLDKATCTSSAFCTGLPVWADDAAIERQSNERLKIRIANQDKRPRDANRRRASRRQYKTSYIAQMSEGMPSDTTMENRRRLKIQNQAKRSLVTPYDTMLANRRRHQMPHFGVDEAIRHDPGKPTPIVAMPTPDAKFCVDERREAIRHDPGKSTPSVRRLSSRRRLRTPNLAKRSLGTPCNTILANRRGASRHRHHMQTFQQMSSGKSCDLSNRRRASRCRHQMPHLASVSPGKPHDTTLANQRRESRRLSSRRRLRIQNEAKKSLGTPCDDAEKPTPCVATPIFTTSAQNSE